MKIIRGRQQTAKKVCVYGPEGIGKSTFASRFPDPLFIDTEGSTRNLDVARFEKPSSWEALTSQVEYVRNNPGTCRTLVVDTIDWAEMLCIEAICRKHRKDGLESFGYGNGYVYTKEEFGRFLNSLSDVIETGVNVVLTAHAQIRKFEQPDELGAYDRWELKLGKKTASQTSPLVKEWADMLLFANYKTYSVAVDEKGKKHKAQGGRRVMYTAHHPCWDAKNRYGLPEECGFDYSVIREIIEGSAPAVMPQQYSRPVQAEHPGNRTQDPDAGRQMELPVNQPAAAQEPEPAGDDAGAAAEASLDKRIPKRLRDLMLADGICEWDLQNVVNTRKPGIFTYDTPVRNYPDDFIDGWILPYWKHVVAFVREAYEKEEIPFN